MIIDKINALAKSNNTTIAAIERECGLNRGTIGKWNKSIPSADKLLKVANFLNMPMEYFLVDGKYSYNLSNEENILITGFRKLNDNYKMRVLERIDTYLELSEGKKENNPKSNITDIDSYLKVSEEHVPYPEEVISKKKVAVKHLPILGQTAAGFPIDIIEVGGGDYVEVPKTADADYALFVKGDSMSPMIQDKDLVFIKSMPEVENGTICVVDIDGTVTCKKIHRFNGRVELISLNEAYAPIIINIKDHKPFRIIGKVTYCQRPNTDFFAI